jgi:hypothetical protein
VLEVLDQRAQLLHRRGDGLIAAHGGVVTREIVSMFSLMCAVVDDCSSLDARTCWMQASIRSALPMIASSALAALSTSSLPRSTWPPTRDMRLDRGLHLALVVLDDLGDLARRLRGALGEALHLLGDDGEGLSVSSRARRLDGRVEREELRLVGDLLDDARDAPICSLLRPRASTVRAEMPTVVTISSMPAKVSRTMRPPSCASVPERCAMSDASLMLRRAARHRLRHLLRAPRRAASD